MRVADKHLGRNVLVAPCHTGDASAAALLQLVGVVRHTLDIAELRHCDDAVLLRDQILDIDLAGYRADLGTSGIGILVADLQRLFLDDLKTSCFVFKDLVEFLDPFAESRDLILDLVALHVGQLTQTHTDDCLRLDVIQTEAFAQRELRRGLILALTDQLDDLVDEVDRDL